MPFLLLAPFFTLAQATPYYLAGGLTDFSDQMIRQNNPVYVVRVGIDSVMILPGPNDYLHASSYKHTTGEPFFRPTHTWSTYTPNYVFVYQKGIFLVEEGGSYLCFLKDKKIADEMLSGDTKSLFKHQNDSLREVVVNINNHLRDENNRAAQVRSKMIATAFIRGLHSSRNDSKLVSDIRKWSGNSTTRVYITAPNYTITRNEFGKVLNKSITAFIKYKREGKCYILWGNFGYESLGNGLFSKDLITFVSTYHYINVPGVGELRLDSGESQEVECN
ncbi:MAG: hypothetical protein KGM98_09755 [Bacteroidota bacterium]|nr:hypothetical protein [Bacteroidota bacterium]